LLERIHTHTTAIQVIRSLEQKLARAEATLLVYKRKLEAEATKSIKTPKSITADKAAKVQAQVCVTV